MAPWLVVGLGNPGDKYEGTRHNAGFMALDAAAKNFQCGAWRLDKAANSLKAECVIPGFTQSVVLAKPQTFMNNSGTAVKKLLPKYSIRDTKYLILIHDDIDLSLGKVKISVGSGSAGHKGVESIVEALGTNEFARIRVGIQPLGGKPENMEQFVLKKFSRAEKTLIAEAIENSCSALETLIAHGLQKAMNEYN